MGESIISSARANGVVEWTFDLPGEKVNKLSSAVMQELDAKLDAIGAQTPELLVLRSAKPGIFIAGADITELQTIASIAEGEGKSRQGQALFDKLESLPFPTLAVIDGACLGGGMELALACRFRAASDHPKTQLGLPEVSLGIIPGWGGTVRLPRLIGLAAALPLILGGKPVAGDKAFKLGLVDHLCAHEFLAEQVGDFVARLLKAENRKSILASRKKRRGWMRLVEATPPGRHFIFKKSREQILEKTRGQYPAPLAAVKAIEEHWGLPRSEAQRIEARHFGELAPSRICKNHIQLFFTGEALKKDRGVEVNTEIKTISRAAVLGAGVMGGGIGWMFSNSDIPIRMKDISWDAVAKGYQAASAVYDQLVKSRRLKPGEANLKMHHISSCVDYRGFQHVDMVVEAIVENIEIKKKVFAELEGHIPETTLICSNTSALSINEMSTALKHPERFIGMHFFNPVNRMPLVEVIPGEHTSPQTVASTVALVKRMKKTPIVVRDVAGFLVNRILLPYLVEAVWVLQDGYPIDKLDPQIRGFGLPMGPLTLADEVGIDVGYKVAKLLEKAYGERMRVPTLLKLIAVDEKLLGKKGGLGFYRHGEATEINTALERLIVAARHADAGAIRQVDDTQALDRCVLIMLNEAARCLEEKVVERPEYLDMAMLMGTGFPAFRGGLLRHADELGIVRVVNRLKELATLAGPRFEPAPLLQQMAAEGRSFYS